MISNVTKGAKIVGLLVYLQGPGKANEHTRPRVIGGHQSVIARAPLGGDLDKASAVELAHAIDEPRLVFGTVVQSTNRRAAQAAVEAGTPAGVAVKDATHDINVWHCSLSIKPEDGELSAEQWGEIAADFMREMGFDDADAPRAAARWVAVHHGLSGDPSTGRPRNDHIHIAASAVREDGTKVDLAHDYKRSQRACHMLEQKYGLTVTQGRADRITERGEQRAQTQAAARQGAVETTRATLARQVRGCAVASTSEAEFVRRVRHEGMLIRPRYAKGSTTAVVGYSVALRPRADKATAGTTLSPVWHGGGKLGADLSLPRLRAGWVETAKSSASAAAEWSHVRRGDPLGSLRPIKAGTKQEHLLVEARSALRDWDNYVRSIPVDDRAGWAYAAGQTAGVYAAWAARVEDTPGPLAATANALARGAGIHARPGRAMAPARRPSAVRVAMIAAAAMTHRSPEASMLVLLRQLAATTRAIADAHIALGDAARAEAMAGQARELVAAHSGAEAAARADGSLQDLHGRLMLAASAPPPGATPQQASGVTPPQRGTVRRPDLGIHQPPPTHRRPQPGPERDDGPGR